MVSNLNYFQVSHRLSTISLIVGLKGPLAQLRVLRVSWDLPVTEDSGSRIKFLRFSAFCCDWIVKFFKMLCWYWFVVPSILYTNITMIKKVLVHRLKSSLIFGVNWKVHITGKSSCLTARGVPHAHGIACCGGGGGGGGGRGYPLSCLGVPPGRNIDMTRQYPPAPIRTMDRTRGYPIGQDHRRPWTGPGVPPGGQTNWKHYLPVVLRTRAVIIYVEHDYDTWVNPLYWSQWGQSQQFWFPYGTRVFLLQNQQFTLKPNLGLVKMKNTQ